jgi:hypothetical protein
MLALGRSIAAGGHQVRGGRGSGLAEPDVPDGVIANRWDSRRRPGGRQPVSRVVAESGAATASGLERSGVEDEEAMARLGLDPRDPTKPNLDEAPCGHPPSR